MSLEHTRVLVLAAGRGRRMGGPKALMDVRGSPWWLRQRERLDRVGIDAVWVVSGPVASAMRRDPGAPASLVESDSDAPMFASVVAGLASLAPADLDGVFVLPVDVPAATRPVWAALAGAGPVAIPAHESVKGHPVWLDWSWARRVVLDRALDPHAARLDRLIEADASVIDVDDPSVRWNLNEPAQLDAWIASGDR